MTTGVKTINTSTDVDLLPNVCTFIQGKINTTAPFTLFGGSPTEINFALIKPAGKNYASVVIRAYLQK